MTSHKTAPIINLKGKGDLLAIITESHVSRGIFQERQLGHICRQGREGGGGGGEGGG